MSDTALVGRFELMAKPDGAFVMVSRSEDIEAINKLIGRAYIAVTWPEYPGAWQQADLSALVGRSGLLVPNSTPDAAQDMRNMAARLLEIGCKLRWTDTSAQPVDWSPADWLDTPEAFIEWARAHTEDYQPPAEPATIDDGPPPSDFPPEATLTARPSRPTRQRPRLASVDGNTALDTAPDADPMPVSMSEDALADYFAAQHGADWRYVKKWNSWFHYDGDGWRRDDTEQVDRLAVQVCREAVTWQEAATLTPEGRRKIAQKRTAWNVRDMSRNDRRIAASIEQWDNDPMLIGVPGGAFHVDTGKVILGEREHYITKRCAVAPAPGKPKRWLDHMKRMMEGDEAMINFLHLYSGYCATGDVSEQVFAFLYGMGQTGKGTFLLTIGELLGDYAVFSEASTFLKRQGDKHLSELARFMNARMVIIDEIPSGSVWNEERIKRCTGGGKITCNFMHSDPFDMEIKFKLAVAGNSKPQLRRVGKEMQRRIRLIKCNASIPDEDVNPNFRAQMIAEEGPKILNWIFEGAMRWRAEGLPLPESVSDATREYLDGEDAIGDWLSENTEQDGETRRPDAYANFKTWFIKQGNDHAWGPQAWWSAMEDRGYTIHRTASDRMVRGLALKLGANLS